MKEKVLNIAYKLFIPLVLMSISRLIFFLENEEYFNIESINQALKIIAFGVRLDLFMVLLINLVFIGWFLFFTPKSKLHKSLIKFWYVVTNSILLLINLIDVFYYPYIFKRINPSFFDYLGTQKNMGSLNTQFIVTYWYGLLALIVFIYLLIKTFNKNTSLIYNSKTIKSWGLFLIIIISISSNFNPLKGIIRSNEIHSNLSNPHQKALVLNTGFNILEQLVYTKNQKPIPFIHTTHSFVNPDSITKKPNIVLIILESFAHEASSLLNPGLARSYMPFLDSLMLKSSYFTNAFANGRQSMDAIPAIWNSLPAQEIPYILKDSTSISLFGLPNVLNDQGYTTLFFHGAQNGSMDFDRFAKQNNIDHYFGLKEYPDPIKDFDGTWGVWDEPFLQYSLEEIDKIHKPFFSTIFTLSSHNPCKIPVEYSSKFKGGDLDIYKSIEYSDYALKQFFRKAQSKPWFNKTLFVITADHSIHPNDNKYTTPENSFAIPLLFFDPGNNTSIKPSRNNPLAQHIDIFPTIIQLLNLETKKEFSMGNNLFSARSKEEILNYYNGIYQYQLPDTTLYFSQQSSTENRDSLEIYLSKKTGLTLKQITH